MKRRQFLWSVAASGTSLLAATSVMAAGGTSVASASALALQSAKSSTASSQSLLLRLDASDPTELCRWRPHAASCVANATRWRVTVHGLLRANSSSLQTMQIKARYADAAGASHHHGLYGFDAGAFDSHSKPVGFSFATGALQALEIEQDHRGTGRYASSCQLEGRLMPGIYALITSPGSGRIATANLDFSGQKNAPLRRRDGQPLALDYLAFEIAEDA